MKYPDVTFQSEGVCCFQLLLYSNVEMADQFKAPYNSTQCGFVKYSKNEWDLSYI
jgi:hypothetical protein